MLFLELVVTFVELLLYGSVTQDKEVVDGN
jgi:hypothetical protein